MIWVFVSVYGIACAWFGFLIGRATKKETPLRIEWAPMCGDPSAEGRRARETGLERNSCPYPAHSGPWWAWQKAWLDARLKPGRIHGRPLDENGNIEFQSDPLSSEHLSHPRVLSDDALDNVKGY